MPFSVNTKQPQVVADYVRGRFSILFPQTPESLFKRIFDDIDALFTGRHPDYQANDLRYHDFEHTLQTTVCMVQLLDGLQSSATSGHLSARQYELAVASALLHDCGYLRLRSDTQGTGAKYTFIHVLRSCAYAASYLPTLGVTEAEIDGVLGAIHCTGPASDITRLQFHDSLGRTVGCALATADYLGQMAADDYPDELGFLFAEFAESYDFFHTSEDKRMFKSVKELQNKTPGFWRNVVMTKLKDDFQSVYRYLAVPYPHGSHPYIEAVEGNIAKIEAQNALSRSVN